MSHFVVLVVGEDIDEQLAPYQENNMGDCPEQYLEFVDQTEEFQNEYDTGTIRVLVDSIGDMHKPQQERFQNPEYHPLSDKPEEKHPYIIPEGFKEADVPFKIRYETFEKFVEEYQAVEKDEKTGRYGYWENPNKKWDWYQIGGRYLGRLVLKNGDSTSQARLKDLDWDGMLKARKESRARTWDEYKTRIESGMDPEIATEIYHIQPEQTQEDYINEAQAISCFAFLKDGQWHEQGHMGMFATVRDSKDKKTWTQEVQDFLDNLQPDDLLTFVDCHI
jgi:hypothetical protein